MMRRIYILILVISLVPGISRAQGADLYRSSVPVPDQSQEAREKAFTPALIQVLGKLSGLRDLDQDPLVTESIVNARSLVVSFYYEQITSRSEVEPAFSEPGQVSPPETLLAVQFAQPGVDQLLRDLGLQRWPPSRSPLTVWLLIDDGFSRQVLPLEYEYLRDSVDQVGDLRGLPLVWPEPDDEGQYNVDVQLLWGGYTEQLEERGYSAEILIITARREGPEWTARLILQYEGDNWTWRSRNIDLEVLLTESVHQVVDQIASMNAIAATEQGQWIHEIEVSGLGGPKAYERCLSYLESLSVVDDVTVVAAASGGVTMLLMLNAAPEYLQQALDEDQVLESEDGSGHYVLHQ